MHNALIYTAALACAITLGTASVALAEASKDTAKSGSEMMMGDPPSSRRRAVAQQTVGASLLAMLLISKYRQIASKLAPTDSGSDLIYAYKTMSYFLFDKRGHEHDGRQ